VLTVVRSLQGLRLICMDTLADSGQIIENACHYYGPVMGIGNRTV
jgi:hypothetical protein